MKYDLLVVGLGIYGASVVAEAGRRGLRVLGIDQLTPPHSNGSSHGRSRILRLTTVESDEYISLARRSLEIWKQLDAVADPPLLSTTGFALIADPGTNEQEHHGVKDLVRSACDVARRNGIPHQRLTAAELMARFAGINLSDAADVFFEPDAAVIDPEAAVRLTLEAARTCPTVSLLTDRRVDSVRAEGDRVHVQVDTGERFVSRRVVLCTGPWQHRALLGTDVVKATLRPQITLSTPAFIDDQTSFPAFAYVRAGELLYGIPPTTAIHEAKVGVEQTSVEVPLPQPESLPSGFIAHQADEARIAAMQLLPMTSFSGSGDLCFYTVAPGSRLVLNAPGGDEKIRIISACSGHGFKYAPAVAESLVSHIAASLAGR